MLTKAAVKYEKRDPFKIDTIMIDEAKDEEV